MCSDKGLGWSPAFSSLSSCSLTSHHNQAWKGDVTSTPEPPILVVHQACALSLNAYTMTQCSDTKRNSDYMFAINNGQLGGKC